MFTTSNILTTIIFLITILAKHFADRIKEERYKTTIEMRLAQLEKENSILKTEKNDLQKSILENIKELVTKFDILKDEFRKCQSCK